MRLSLSGKLGDGLRASPQKGKVTDHINRNKLDNRKQNLRFCSYSVNNNNSNLRSDNTSGVKGVSFKKKSNKWKAEITNNGKYIFLGNFNTKEGAQKAYETHRISLGLAK